VDTTETLRHPALHTGCLWFRFQLPCVPRSIRVSLARSCQTGGGLFRPGVLRCRRPPFRLSCTDSTGLLRFPGNPSRTSAVLQDPGRTEKTSPISILSMLPPHPTKRRLQHSHDLVAKMNGFSTRCLRFTNRVASAHARLTSGWLASLCREGVEPSGLLRKVSVLSTSLPPPLGLS
jgi:hypothetical protein